MTSPLIAQENLILNPSGEENSYIPSNLAQYSETTIGDITSNRDKVYTLRSGSVLDYADVIGNRQSQIKPKFKHLNK